MPRGCDHAGTLPRRSRRHRSARHPAHDSEVQEEEAPLGAVRQEEEVQEDEEVGEIAVGLLAAPGLAAEVAESLAPELSKRLNELYPEVDWEVPLETDAL